MALVRTRADWCRTASADGLRSSVPHQHVPETGTRETNLNETGIIYNSLILLKERLAGGPGFEPGLTESESAVLPLNYPPAGEGWGRPLPPACARCRQTGRTVQPYSPQRGRQAWAACVGGGCLAQANRHGKDRVRPETGKGGWCRRDRGHPRVTAMS